jgi:thiol-disulfide isomerase/thioredoxin
MKKRISLIVITALVASFVAFSGMSSAQASNVQVVFFTSPMCSVCQQVHPLAQSAAAKYGVPLIVYDVSTPTGKAVAQANSVSETPTIVISGAKTTRLEGFVTQAQIEASIQQAIGAPTLTTTPKTTVKGVQTTTPKTTVNAATTVKQGASAGATKAIVKADTQPAIQVATPTQTPTNAMPTVPEFPLFGLGAPALLAGAIYLFLRRK